MHMRRLRSVLLLTAAAACGPGRTPLGDPHPQIDKVEKCEQALLETMPDAFRYPGLRRCFCEKHAAGRGAAALAECGGRCLIAYSQTEPEAFKSEEAARCVCDAKAEGKTEREARQTCRALTAASGEN